MLTVLSASHAAVPPLRLVVQGGAQRAELALMCSVLEMPGERGHLERTSGLLPFKLMPTNHSKKVMIYGMLYRGIEGHSWG